MFNEDMIQENEEFLGVEELEEIELEDVNGGRTVLHVKRGTLKVHSKPSSGSTVLCTVDRYDDLVCVGEAKRDSHNKTWIKVRVNGYIGWIRGDKAK